MAELLRRVRRGFKQWLVRSKEYTVGYTHANALAQIDFDRKNVCYTAGNVRPPKCLHKCALIARLKVLDGAGIFLT